MRYGAQVVDWDDHAGVPGELLIGTITVAKWTETISREVKSDGT